MFIDSTRADLIERFAKEGRLLARLSHPNIAQLIDAGVTEDGKQFLVLEYVDGKRIDDYCESGSLTVEARVRLFLGAVSAVAHAHSQLVIHRDLKPSNVLVDRDGTVKLLDFGIAKLLSAEPSLDDGSHTRAEESALTPDYAAPEQLLGDVPSTATDLYQLGVLLYVLLTGRHPFQLSGTRAERVKALFDNQMPLASEACSGPLRKALRGDLDAILAKALDNESSKRYPTAAALHDELIRYLNREPVQARRGTGLYQVHKFVARHRLIVGVSTTALVALCATAIFAIHQARVAGIERDRAVSLALRNDAVNDFLETLITEAVEADTPVTVTEMVARSERLALLDSSGSRENRAAVLYRISGRYQSLGDFDKAAQFDERALALLKTSRARDLRAEITCDHATVISDLGRLDEAMRITSQELADPSHDPMSRAECLRARAKVTMLKDDMAGSLQFALQALAAIRLGGPASKTREVPFLDAVAVAYQKNGRTREALHSYELVLQNLTETGRKWSPTGVAAHNNFGALLANAGVPRRALQVFEDALKVLATRDPGGQPPVYLLANRARVLDSLGRYKAAQADYLQALQIARSTKFTTAELVSLTGFASVAIRLEQFDTAADYLRQATQLLGSSDEIAKFPGLPLALGNLALANGNLDDARRQFELLATGNNISIVIESHLGKAEVLLRTGHASEAASDVRTALQAAQSLQGDLRSRPHVAVLRDNHPGLRT